MDKKIILGLKLRKDWLLLLLETNWTIDRMLQKNEDFLLQIQSLIILKDSYHSATDIFINSHQYSTYKYRWCHHWRTDFQIRNFCFVVYVKDDFVS